MTVSELKNIQIGMSEELKGAFIDKVWRAQVRVDYNVPPSHVACEVLRQMLDFYCQDKLHEDMRNYHREFGDEALIPGGFDICKLSFKCPPNLHRDIVNQASKEGKKITRLCKEIIVDYLNGKYNIRIDDCLKISVVR